MLKRFLQDLRSFRTRRHACDRQAIHKDVANSDGPCRIAERRYRLERESLVIVAEKGFAEFRTP